LTGGIRRRRCHAIHCDGLLTVPEHKSAMFAARAAGRSQSC
jgi:hypothetical protein